MQGVGFYLFFSASMLCYGRVLKESVVFMVCCISASIALHCNAPVDPMLRRLKQKNKRFLIWSDITSSQCLAVDE